MNDRLKQAEELMAKVFDELNESPSESLAQRRFDFAFHMCDWLADLDGLYAALANPAAVDPEKFASNLYGTLFHIIPHLRAAFRALDGREAPDPFLDPLDSKPTNGIHATRAVG